MKFYPQTNIHTQINHVYSECYMYVNINNNYRLVVFVVEFDILLILIIICYTHTVHFTCTVEPLIRNLRIKDTIKRTLLKVPNVHSPIVLIYFQPLKREKPLYKGKNSWCQRVLYSEVPVYSYFTSTHAQRIFLCTKIVHVHVHAHNIQDTVPVLLLNVH